MLDRERKAAEVLGCVLPDAVTQIKSALGNIGAAVSALVPPEAREKDSATDQKMSILMQSYFMALRTVENLSMLQRLLDRVPLHMVNVDFAGLCRGVCVRAEHPAESKGITLSFSCEKSSYIAAVDADMVERLLLNLLSNAIKFTPRGGSITVKVQLTREQVLLTVSDTGCGISEERLETLFDTCCAERDTPAPAPHGAGVGLTLCRLIAEGHGGRIFLQSKPGGGTQVTASFENRKLADAAVRERGFDYAGGFNRTLLELSDALGIDAFNVKNTD